ncbi:DUF5985 family protein [Hyalangium gracile]|uniref:DUF5985 family protein n=1 Tax=Hyalangium gracile TaxID=394092 RepID=UPI001CCF87AC|nr:DUF5985 family protein [Hyalangium gracile]
MAEAVYILCALTSVACAVLLLRGYGRSRSRLLLWSGLCFMALAISNMVLFVDLVVVQGVDLSLLRSSLALLGIATLLYGLIWDAQ